MKEQLQGAAATMSNDLLVAIISGDVNAIEAAKKELKARGYDSKGNWIGIKY